MKVGMITTLSGGGAGLGIDVRDGFHAGAQASGPNTEIEVVVEDDAQKPETAVQIADKMIQSDKVDILTGIIWSNLAMAVVPSASRRASSTSRPTPAPRRWPARAATQLLQRRLAERQPARGAGATTPTRRATRTASSWRRTIRPAPTR
jgi:hypothetical protein